MNSLPPILTKYSLPKKTLNPTSLLSLTYNCFVAISLLFITSITVHSQITVNGVNTTPITCPNNGSITISASTTVQPLLYSILSGPVTQPVQTNPVFTSLPPGNYVIKISDGALNQTTVNATISGVYQNPAFTITNTTPYCVGNSDGQLVGNINPGTGTPPFQWQLLAPSPVITAPQISSTFNGLPAGNYSMRVTDACGSFSSNAVSLQNPVTGFAWLGQNIGQLGNLVFNKVGCDSMLVTYWLSIPNPRMPLSFKYNTTNGVFIPTSGTVVDTSFMSSSSMSQVMVSQIIPGIDYGQSVQATIYNSCGDSAMSMDMTTHPFIFYPRYVFYECGNAATVTFANTPYNEFHTSIKVPATYVFTDATNNVLESGTITAQQNNGLFSMSDTLTTGGTYHFSITDGCGETFSSNFIVPELAPPVIIHEDIFSAACIDSVVGAYRVLTAGFQNNAKLILLSGPSELGSTKPGFAYADTYTYPDTVPMINGESFMMNNLAIGTYQYKIIDDCGNELPGSMTITPDQVTSLKTKLLLEEGCPGRNKIYYGMVSGGKVTIRDITTNTILKESEFIAYTQNWEAEQNNKDSLINLFDGFYEITYQFLQGPGALESGKQVNDGNIPCWLIVDTVHILPYHTPEMFTGNAIMCNNTINFVLEPDTSTGIPPYQYEIIAGPQIFPVQSSNIFTINQPGTYTARIYDECDNASIKQITVDTISFDPIEVHAQCNNTNLLFPSSIYNTYEWLMPNGQVYIDDRLIIDPITPADTGIYHITRIVNINGCSDTLQTTYHLSLNLQTSQTIEFCEGASVTIGTSIYTLPGVYSDTLTAIAGCDSIVISNLVWVPIVSDTIQVTICNGDSILIAGEYQYIAGFYTDSVQNALGCYDLMVTDLTVLQLVDTVNAAVCSGVGYNFGGDTYYTPGFYNDTLITANGCDSVVTLHLSLQAYIHHAISDSICMDGSFSFGGNILTVAGIYSDTLSTTTCDSIVTLTLTVLPYIQHSISENICMDGSFSFGGNILTVAGIYSDTLSTNSCDSIVTLTLTVLPYIQHAISESICEYGSYNFGGNMLTQAGVYVDTLSTTTCDSIVTLTLTVLPYIHNSVNATICQGDQYLFVGNWLNTAGTYIDTVSTTTCDSIVTLNLSVSPYKFHSYSLTVCQNDDVFFGGNNLTTSGTYTDTLATTSCDSIVTLVLTILPLKYSTINETICSSEKYPFGGTHYTQAGTYTHTFSTNTCDSIVTLHLTVLQGPSVHITSNAYETNEGAFVQLHANSNTHPLGYLWTSDVVLNNNSIQSPTTNIRNPTWVYVSVTDANGCTATDSFLIEIPVTSTLYIPNCFTPGGNNTNEFFKIYGTNIAEFEVMIFNRWGELIFESTNLDYGWDGKYMDEIVQNGMYVYKVLALGLDGTRYNRTGHVTVLR